MQKHQIEEMLMERSEFIKSCTKKNILTFIFFFLFYAYQRYEVSPFPIIRCLGSALFVTSILVLADVLFYWARFRR